LHFTLSDLVTDITQNAAESGAGRVELEIYETDKEFRFVVKDNGKGMNEDELKRAVDPFVTDGIKHPHRKVGLGIPFLIQTAVQSGGGWDIKSQKNAGTTVTAWFDVNNVDTPPEGDISGMFRTIILFPGPKETIVRRSLADGTRNIHYELSKSELVEVLGNLEDTSSLVLLDRYLKSMEEDDEETDNANSAG
jgi:hypothetical protein